MGEDCKESHIKDEWRVLAVLTREQETGINRPWGLKEEILMGIWILDIKVYKKKIIAGKRGT